MINFFVTFYNVASFVLIFSILLHRMAVGLEILPVLGQIKKKVNLFAQERSNTE